MQRRLEKEWDLAIGPDTVRHLALKAKGLSAAVNEDYEDGHDHEVELNDQARDSHHHDGLAEEESRDLTEDEFRQLVGDLNEDEAADLVAIAWLGRGDYDVAEWMSAVTEAKRRGLSRTAAYLLGMPQLGEYLESGLETLGA